MKNNSAVNNAAFIDKLQSWIGPEYVKCSDFRFMRKGKIGSHREELTAEYIAKLDAYIERQLQGTDFRFME